VQQAFQRGDIPTSRPDDDLAAGVDVEIDPVPGLHPEELPDPLGKGDLTLARHGRARHGVASDPYFE
jgi:hypothetical protein